VVRRAGSSRHCRVLFVHVVAVAEGGWLVVMVVDVSSVGIVISCCSFCTWCTFFVCALPSCTEYGLLSTGGQY